MCIGLPARQFLHTTLVLAHPTSFRIYMNAVDELDDEHVDADAKVFLKNRF